MPSSVIVAGTNTPTIQDNPWVKLGGWGGAEQAKQIILQSIERYNATPEGQKPPF